SSRYQSLKLTVCFFTFSLFFRYSKIFFLLQIVKISLTDCTNPTKTQYIYIFIFIYGQERSLLVLLALLNTEFQKENTSKKDNKAK
ncbi:hypothetical protein F4703DRAFT_1902242, partial [Phycomyces blakesleeanus]